MAKRWLVCRVIGTGMGTDDSFRPEAADVPYTSAKGIVPTHPEGHPQQGQPKFRFALAQMATLQLAQVEQLLNSHLLPDVTLDAQLGAMGEAAYAAMVQNLEAYDLDGAGYQFDLAAITPAHTLRDLILALATQLDPLWPNTLTGLDVEAPANE